MSDYTAARWNYLKALGPRSGTLVAHKLSAKRLARKAVGASRRQWKRIAGAQRTRMIEYAQGTITRRNNEAAIQASGGHRRSGMSFGGAQ